MNIQGIDHLVLTVRDIESTCKFYTQILGMRVVEFAGNRKALSFGKQKINLHQQGREFKPKAGKPTAGSADLCFLADTDLSKIITHLKKQQITIIEGPVQRTGATGALLSIYFRDPDDNLIEIANPLHPDNDTEN